MKQAGTLPGLLRRRGCRWPLSPLVAVVTTDWEERPEEMRWLGQFAAAFCF